ncbi:MAG: hypothetical protein N3E52_04520 [Candidatus Bathyarchaeota archaeon]|nr:hypothetical protein [Candidatus Bathyarchaeota archaeon]
MKNLFNTKARTLIVVIVLVLFSVNMYLLFDLRRLVENTVHDSIYDYVVFQEGSMYKARNYASGYVEFASDDAARVISQAITKGNVIYLKAGNYTLNSDIIVNNKQRSRILSNGAVIIGNGKRFIIRGDAYNSSQNNFISGLTIINGTLRIENSFGTTVTNMAFTCCAVAIEVVNTETWSEGTEIADCRFINSTVGIIFRTPVGNGTGSYASSKISRCFFNLLDDSVGIVVERLAEFSDSQISEVRMWMGENGFMRNQTGLLVDGSMHQTLLLGVVFESFADNPDQLYAIALGATSITPPILAGGVTFLGNWTAKIYNPNSKWIAGVGSIFKQEDLRVSVGLNGQYGPIQSFQMRPLTIAYFKAKIDVQGSFAYNETITVRFRLEFVDNVISKSVEKSFNNTTTLWLSDDDLLRMYPSQSVIWNILIDAKASSASTDAVVMVSILGVNT